MPTQQRQRRRPRTNRFLMAAAAAVPALGLMAGGAIAQQRVDNRALNDANNRIGSGGYNDAGGVRRPLPGQLGNQIVTGNVTGAKEFRGGVDYTDPGAFRGRTATEASDFLIRRGAGTADARIADQIYNNQPRPFYGDSRAAPPPRDYVATPGYTDYVGSGIGARPIDTQRRIDNQVREQRDQMLLPRPGELVLPGPVSTDAPALITASPLYGVRAWESPAAAEQYYLSTLTGQPRQPAGPRLDETTIQQMRQELIAAPAAGDDAAGQQPDGAGGATEPGRATTPGAGAVPLEGGRPLGSSLEPRRVNDVAGAVTLDTTGGAVTGQGTRQRLLLPPTLGNTQLAEMRRRLDAYNDDPTVSDQERRRAFDEAMRARDGAAAAGPREERGEPGAAPAPGATPPAGQQAAPAPGQQQQQPGGAGGLTGEDLARRNEELMRNPAAAGQPPSAQQSGQPQQEQSSRDAAGVRGPTKRPEPVRVGSLATGVPGKGMADLMASAEASMRDGKYAAALDTYDQAEQVAPGSALVRLGRAHAELGSGSYNRAASHLRQAFEADPALLVGQYDLKAFLGEERLQAVVTDLKDIANKEQALATPVFLLAYVAYNTDNERMAAGYLDLAEKRSDGKDPLYATIRRHWTLPAGGDPADLAAPQEPAASPSGELNK